MAVADVVVLSKKVVNQKNLVNPENPKEKSEKVKAKENPEDKEELVVGAKVVCKKVVKTNQPSMVPVFTGQKV